MLLTDVSSMEDTTGASNTNGSFDSGAAAAAAPLAAQPQRGKKKQNLWLEMENAETEEARSVLGTKSLTSTRRGGRGRRPLAGVGASGLRRGSRPAAAQHRFHLRLGLRFHSSLLLQALETFPLS